MPDPIKRKAGYEDLMSLPDNVVGEIVSGELVATPRPLYRHGLAFSALGAMIIPAYQFGRGGGPGGWWILDEPEVHLGEHVLVPDLAGWRRERMPELPQTNWTGLPPDWVCEILSPGTLRLDRIQKMPLYAQHGVPFLWLVDPDRRILETFGLEQGRWALLGTYLDDDKVRAEPFREVEIDLVNLWVPERVP